MRTGLVVAVLLLLIAFLGFTFGRITVAGQYAEALGICEVSARRGARMLEELDETYSGFMSVLKPEDNIEKAACNLGSSIEELDRLNRILGK